MFVVTREVNLWNVIEDFEKVELSDSNLYHLGGALKLPQHEIDKYIFNHPGDKAQVRNKIINIWLKNNVDCSWGTLAETAEKLGEGNLARKLRSKYADICNC